MPRRTVRQLLDELELYRAALDVMAEESAELQRQLAAEGEQRLLEGKLFEGRLAQRDQEIGELQAEVLELHELEFATLPPLPADEKKPRRKGGKA